MLSESHDQVVVPDGDPEWGDLLRSAADAEGIPSNRLHVFDDVPEESGQWLERIGNSKSIIVGWHVPVEVLHMAPRLEKIVFSGTGADDFIDLAVAAERGIEVVTIKSYADNAVAEHALSLMLSVLSDIPRLDRAVRDGAWPAPIRRELAGQQLAIVGVGGIGRRFAELAHGVGMKVVAVTRKPTELPEWIRAVSLEEAAATSDVVSLHLPLNGETRGVIGSEFLSAMKSGSVLVNTARAGVVDNVALVAALRDGRLAGAGIDVFDHEPASRRDELLSCPNVVLTPHVGFNSSQANERLAAECVRKAFS